MPSPHNGQASANGVANRRFRFDDSTSHVHRHSLRAGRARGTLFGHSHSGRLFVLAAGFTVLVIWGVLNLVFNDWRAKYRERAAYGAAVVVPTIDPLTRLKPPGVDLAQWRDAVRDTRLMLTTVIGSNLLDLREMATLRAEIQAVVQRAVAEPATACRELAGVWDLISERGEFLFKDSRSASGERHRRPRLLPTYGETRVAPAIDALDDTQPPGVNAAEWHEAVRQTRAMLVALTGSDQAGITRLSTLRAQLDHLVAMARAHPERALEILAAIWDQTDAQLESLAQSGRTHATAGYQRPKIFRPPAEESARSSRFSASGQKTKVRGQ